jgi:hypothetical protein
LEIEIPPSFTSRPRLGFGKNVKDIITPSGDSTSSFDEMKDAMLSHFVDLYSEKGDIDLEDCNYVG